MKRTEQEEIQLVKNVVDHFMQAVKNKLIESVKSGKTGWDGECPEHDLCDKIRQDAEYISDETPCKKTEKAVDIAQSAMRIWYTNYGKALMTAD